MNVAGDIHLLTQSQVLNAANNGFDDGHIENIKNLIVRIKSPVKQPGG
jgi:hypothetical protein